MEDAGSFEEEPEKAATLGRGKKKADSGLLRIEVFFLVIALKAADSLLNRGHYAASF
jgi:hypothetical protein